MNSEQVALYLKHHPEFFEEEVERAAMWRFARVRQIEEHGIYQPVPAP